MESDRQQLQITTLEGIAIRDEMQRKVKIITWLLPRFWKGLSNPTKYTKLIGSEQ